MTTTTATRRFLRVILEFSRTASGRLMGGIKIVCPKPYASTDFYYVTIDEAAKEAVFVKEDARKTTHLVDLDMNCCDCAGFGYRKHCRHLGAVAALRKSGKI